MRSRRRDRRTTAPRPAVLVGLGFAVGLGIAHAHEGTAQQPPLAPDSLAPAVQPIGVSPRGAFVRALLVPGWGHVSIGAYTRGGFYFALETATAYTFIRTRIRLGEARERAALREQVLRARLAAAGVTDPEAIGAALDADATLRAFRNLVGSRERQQEDLIAWGIFLLFLAGADAYVSAHLARFPAPIELEATAQPGARVELALHISLPR